MAGQQYLTLVLAAAVLVLLAAVEGTLHTKPRLLRPKQNLLQVGNLAADMSSLDCQNQASSCSDCTTRLTCVRLLNTYRPLSNTACPSSTPYCVGAGECSATPVDDTCRQQQNRATDFTCVGDGYFPSPSNCRRYYYCADGVPYEYDCTQYGTTRYGPARAMCVPTSEVTCNVASCTRANIGAYQQWRSDRSVYFVCTDTNASHAYVADCGENRQIDANGDCVLTCTREGRFANAADPKQYYECVQTGTTTFVGPTALTCPGSSVFDPSTERCVTSASANPGPEVVEDYYAPRSDINEDLMYTLPDGFRIGAASAAYQIEGGWDADGKGPSIWDSFFHQRPSMENGDVSADSYHKWEDDVQALKDLGMKSYRFSLSWPRLLPQGDASQPNQNGIDYYMNLIDRLIEEDITPVVTLHHWDMPNNFQEYDGGWLSRNIVDRFVSYADFVFSTFGDKVKTWMMMNEPHIFCTNGYETGFGAPGVAETGTGAYMCVHNMILAHARAWHLYNDVYRATQNGIVGSAFDIQFAQPASDSQEDVDAAERALVFGLAWLTDPLLRGDYPQLMKDMVLANSLGNGLTQSRLPTFTAEEQQMIRGTLDFIAINHYTTLLLSPPPTVSTTQASYDNDTYTLRVSRPEWQHSARYSFAICPWGLRGILNWIRNRYNNIPVFISENGWGGPRDEGLEDPDRTTYYSTYLRAMLRAIHQDGCNVIGYTAWSLTDNLEWSEGYSIRYGLARIDQNDPDRRRVLKQSSRFFQEVAATRKVNYYNYSS